MYKPYGEQRTIQKSSSIKNRDNFTGKELDTEGEVGTLLFDITVSGFTDLTMKNYASSLDIHFTDGTVEKHTLDQWAPGFDKLIHKKMISYNEEKTLEKAELVVMKEGAELLRESTALTGVTTTTGNKSTITYTKDITSNTSTGFAVAQVDEGIYFGIKLNYFGARYYDAEVGLWTSTDPKEQFYGAYTYTGTGFNPIISVDPDGNKIRIIGSNRFRQSVETNLLMLQEPGGMGAYLVDQAYKHKMTIVIRSTDKGNYAGSNEFGSLIIVGFNPIKITGGEDVNGKYWRPQFVGLGHELQHVVDFANGTQSLSDYIDNTGIPLSEQNAVRTEQFIRAKNGLLLRKVYYGKDLGEEIELQNRRMQKVKGASIE